MAVYRFALVIFRTAAKFGYFFRVRKSGMTGRKAAGPAFAVYWGMLINL